MDRLKPTDLCMGESMPYNQHWEVRVVATPDDLKDIDDKFLLNCRDRVRAGDKLSIVAFAARNYQEIVAVMDCRVVSVSTDGVRLLKFEIAEVMADNPTVTVMEREKFKIVKHSAKEWAVVSEKNEQTPIELFKSQSAAANFLGTL